VTAYRRQGSRSNSNPLARDVQTPPEPLSSAALRARAIAALARREHSRKELEHKFLPLSENPEQLAAVLDRLQSEGLLSDRRYAESVARTRGQRFGSARIRHELSQKGVADNTLQSVVAELRDSEADRLRQVWERKFGTAPQSLQDASRQQRFLAQRGFSAEAISRLLRSLRAG